MVETEFGEVGLLGGVGFGIAGLLGLCELGETRLLLLLGLGAVLVEEGEELLRGVLVEGVRELGDGGGNLEALVKDHLLALETNVLRPLHEAGEVSLVLDILAWRM